MTELNNEQKINTHRYYIWLISCSIPRMFWDKPEEEHFFACKDLVGFTAEKTDWDVIYPIIRRDHKPVWDHAISLSKIALGIES